MSDYASDFIHAIMNGGHRAAVTCVDGSRVAGVADTTHVDWGGRPQTRVTRFSGEIVEIPDEEVDNIIWLD